MKWLLLLIPSIAFGHGLQPSRLEAPSGSKLVAYRFTAVNYYKEWDEYAVECFKSNLSQPYPCQSAPSQFRIAPNKSRLFKVQIAPNEDAVYLVCTIQTKQAAFVTRICARFGVGVDPSTNGDRLNKLAKHSRISAGAR